MVILYGTYLIYDTQLLVGGRRQQYTEDDYIIAAIQLYLDIIIIFLEILKAMDKWVGCTVLTSNHATDCILINSSS